MSNRLLALVLAGLLTPAAGAADPPAPPPAVTPVVKMPPELKVDPGRLATITIESNGRVTRYGCLDPAVDVFREYDPDPAKIRLRVIAYTPGRYAVYAYTAIGDVPSDVAVCWVTVGTPPPVPPTPTPGPPTPTPTPTPTPGPAAPIAGDGFRVLIVYESADVTRLTPGQNSAIFGKEARDYMRAKCAKDAANPNGAWRIWDKDVDASGESKSWQDAMKRDRKSVPWIVISDGKTGYEGPLPDRESEFLALLKKYGG